MKTKNDVIIAGLRRAKVLGPGETPAAEIADATGEIFDAMVADFQQFVPGDGFWVNIPEHVYWPLVNLMAAEVAPEYGLQAPVSRASAYSSLMAQMRPDDREETEPEYY